MSIDVRIPYDLWEEDSETGASVLWVVPDGARVQQGDVIAELLVEKITFEIEAPVSGILRFLVNSDAIVNRGDRLAVVVSGLV